MKTRLAALILALIILLASAPAMGASIAVYRDIPIDGAYHMFTLGDNPIDVFYLYRVKVPILCELTIEARTARDIPLTMTFGMTSGISRVEGEYRITTLQGWANPGDIALGTWENGMKGAIEIRASMRPLNLDLNEPPEPNGSAERAGVLTEGIRVRGAIAMEDRDWYKITLPRDCEIELSLTQDQMPLNALIQIPGSSQGIGVDNGSYESTPLSAPRTQTACTMLRAGDHYISVESCYYACHDTTYSIRYKIIGDPVPKLSAPGLKLYVGEREKLGYTVEPISFNWPAPSIVISNRKIATFDAATGLVSAVAPGKTKVILELNGVKYTTSVHVRKNEYNVSKPAKGKQRLVYMSHRRLYYKNNYLCAETYVYNKTRRTLKGYPFLVGVVYDLVNERVVAATPIGRWRPSGGVRPGNYKVVKFKIARTEPGLSMEQALRLDLKSYVALVVDASDLNNRSLKKFALADGLALNNDLP